MEIRQCVWFLPIVATMILGCSEKPNIGSPVGKWGVFKASVVFAKDGAVVWHNDGEEFNPEFLAPLEVDKPGNWKTDGRLLLLTATKPDGTTETRRYEYSVGTDDKGKPAIDIIPEGSNKGGYILKKQ